jgi:phospholipase C
MFPNTSIHRKSRLKMVAGVSMTALTAVGAAMLLPQGASQSALAAAMTQPAPGALNLEQIQTNSPIKHIIYIVGENRSFDNVYGTYQPKSGQKVWNLLSQGIVNADGSPGPNAAQGRQYQATSTNGRFFLSPLTKSAYTFLPVPTISSAQPEGVGLEFGIVTAAGKPTATFPEGDPDLPLQDQITLTTGGTGAIPSRYPHSRRQSIAGRTLPADRTYAALRRL